MVQQIETDKMPGCELHLKVMNGKPDIYNEYCQTL